MAVSLSQHKRMSPRSAARLRRQIRVRKKVFGAPQRPRLVVTRSARHISAQVIDDTQGRTLASASTMEAALRAATGDKSEKAKQVGGLVAERAKAVGIEKRGLRPRRIQVPRTRCGARGWRPRGRPRILTALLDATRRLVRRKMTNGR